MGEMEKRWSEAQTKEDAFWQRNGVLSSQMERVSVRYGPVIKEIEKDSAIVGEVRGKGLMLGIELVNDKGSKKPAPDLARQIRTLCHRNGLLIEIGGHYDNVARFLPPLVLTDDLAGKGIEIFADAVRRTENSR